MRSERDLSKHAELASAMAEALRERGTPDPAAVAPRRGAYPTNKIKEWRGLATRYDKTATSYLAGLHLRGAVIWIRSLRPK